MVIGDDLLVELAVPLPRQLHGHVNGFDHRFAGREEMPGAVSVRFGVDAVGRVGQGVQPAQEGAHVHGKAAPLVAQQDFVGQYHRTKKKLRDYDTATAKKK